MSKKEDVVHVFFKYFVKRWTYLSAPSHNGDSTRNSDKNSLVLMRYEKIRFFWIFVHCNLAIWSITFKFIEYDARPIAISPTSVEQKKFKPGGAKKFF